MGTTHSSQLPMSEGGFRFTDSGHKSTTSSSQARDRLSGVSASHPPRIEQVLCMSRFLGTFHHAFSCRETPIILRALYFPAIRCLAVAKADHPPFGFSPRCCLFHLITILGTQIPDQECDFLLELYETGLCCKLPS